jgi:hypothetical protein
VTLFPNYQEPKKFPLTLPLSPKGDREIYVKIPGMVHKTHLEKLRVFLDH